MITYRYVNINEPFQCADSTLMAYIPQGMSLKLKISLDGNCYDEIPDSLIVVGDLSDSTEKILQVNNLMCNTYLMFTGTGKGKIKIKK